jgi:hypothetical protein
MKEVTKEEQTPTKCESSRDDGEREMKGHNNNKVELALFLQDCFVLHRYAGEDYLRLSGGNGSFHSSRFATCALLHFTMIVLLLIVCSLPRFEDDGDYDMVVIAAFKTY